ncbi:tetratricopeptide repeat protein [Algoriphagus sp. CAU 1675]|uniref:tetratricopeptide repeat-containing sensor histidine kinase n=1 Tax=Algoriphagus sp. CAU 1675 TaxID=3032597 RepID=UPI0023DBD083|nr:tetratricopeptide repeat protein [Algoriphagus sp. CAU 1675]MDF2158106.1 tetratricopeptide repeat protein [Algoriphagus sp. CAU 1675]
MKPIRFSLLTLSFFLFVLVTAFAQGPNLDSLTEKLEKSVGEERVRILNILATNIRETQQDLAFQYSIEAEKLSQELGLISQEAKAKENIGWIYYRKGQWRKTFDYSEDAYELAMRADDQTAAARVLNNMGALYYEQQNFPKAIEQFKMAYEISSKSGDIATQIRSLNNVAFNFTQMGELDSALYYANAAIHVNVSEGSPYLTSFSNRVIGDVFFAKGELESAADIYEQSLEMARVQNLTTFKASVLHRLGNTYRLLGELDKAETVLNEGIELSKSHHLLDELSKSHKYLALVYEMRGNIPKAYEHQSEYLAISDSLITQSNRDRIALMQGMFQENLQKSEVELLMAQNENQANRLKFIKRIVWVVSIAAILILALVIWLGRLYRNIKKINRDLIDQKQMINDQNLDLEAKSQELESINQTKNKLFSIIGHDLMGPVGQVKAIIDLVLAGHLQKEEFQQILSDLKKDIDSVYLTLNNTLKWSLTQMEGFKVNSSEIDFREIVDDTIRLLDHQFKAKEISLDFQMPSKEEIFADKDLIEVVVRNIISNAVKFSRRGGEVQIVSNWNQNSLSWSVVDSGTGMSQEQIDQILKGEYAITSSQLGTNKEKGSGLGLQVCKEFVSLLGGELTIESKLGLGTKVSVQIPLKVLEPELKPTEA